MLFFHEDNQAVSQVLNSMVSASPSIMSDLRKLQKLLTSLRVNLDVRWVLLAVNRYADSLSRTWDPGGFQVSQTLLQSIQYHYLLDSSAFCARPMNEALSARLKHIW